MKILVVAATTFEINDLLRTTTWDYDVSFLVTGIGTIKTTFELTRHLLTQTPDYDLVLNVGICGSYDRSFELGSIVNVTQDCIADIGIDHNAVFYPVDKILHTNANDTIYNNSSIPSHLIQELPQVNGITVNTVTGSEDRVQQLLRWYSPQVESMEGAAFAYTCEQLNKKYVQIRSISNYVEARNKSAWKVQDAIKNLNHYITYLLQEL